MIDQALQIPEQDWRKLLAAASGDAALLYLFLRAGGFPDQAPAALRLSEPRMECAVASLKQMGLWPEEPKILRPAQPPVYTEADLLQAEQQSDFPSLLGEAQRRLGRVLSTEEAKILLSLYDYLGMPVEVISILLSYCIQRNHARGNSRNPSMHAIEREAYHWADLGIDTMEEAAAHMQLQLDRQSKVGRVRQVLGLRDRKLTPGEEKLVLQWLDWGFGPAEIGKAYEKTCMNTGGLKWPYLNSILKSWHSQGLHTLQAIEAGDKAPGAPNSTYAQPAAPSQLAKDAIARMMQHQEE